MQATRTSSGRRPRPWRLVMRPQTAPRACKVTTTSSGRTPRRRTRRDEVHVTYVMAMLLVRPFWLSCAAHRAVSYLAVLRVCPWQGPRCSGRAALHLLTLSREAACSNLFWNLGARPRRGLIFVVSIDATIVYHNVAQG